jgi:putative DNA primase/helicase
MIKTSEFLAVFRQPDEALHLRCFKPRHAVETAENKPLMVDTSLAELTSNRELQRTLIMANKTLGIYFCPNVGGSTDESITSFTSWFVEDDSLTIAEQHERLDTAPIQPCARTETRKSVHAYWLVQGDCSTEEWTNIQLRLISFFGSDPKVKNPSRVLRLPNFDHLFVNGNGVERKKVVVTHFEPQRRYTVSEMCGAFPAPAPKNVSQGQQWPATGTFEYHEQRNVALGHRIMSRGKRNKKANWDAQCLAHNGTGGKGLVYFPTSGAVKCNAEPPCDYFSILRAEGLPDGHLPSREKSIAMPASHRENDFEGQPPRDFEPQTDEKEIQRLAALSPLEYERERLTAAKTLKCRPSTLDKMVCALRPKTEGLQGRELNLPEIEPWPDRVNGAEVLNEVSAAFARYVALPPGAADVLAVWAAHAHAVDAFDVSPRLNFSSPEKGCGKTTARDVTGLFVPRALATENLSVAVLFRIVESHKPTILADEYDAWLSDNEELRGLFNAGHRRGGQALRCEGEGNEVRAFGVFTPAILCGIGALPGTLHDRSIEIRLNRAKPGEVRKRFDSRHTEREQALCRKLARWCADSREQIAACDPALPEGAYNRVADNWRPLFAVAQVAGGDWPQRVRASFAELSKAEADEQGLGIMLLADIKEIFTDADAERMFSQTLVEKLVALTDRPWVEARRDKPVTENWLARRLRPFGVVPKSIRIDEKNKKGYELYRLEDAFCRYLPPQGVSNRHTVTTRINIDENEKHNRHNENACDGLKTHETPINIGLCQRDGCEGGVGRITREIYVEPTREEWKTAAASDPEAWDRLVTASERHAIEYEEILG